MTPHGQATYSREGRTGHRERLGARRRFRGPRRQKPSSRTTGRLPIPILPHPPLQLQLRHHHWTHKGFVLNAKHSRNRFFEALRFAPLQFAFALPSFKLSASTKAILLHFLRGVPRHFFPF